MTSRTVVGRRTFMGSLAAGQALSRPVAGQVPGRSVPRFVPPFDLRSLDPIVDTGLTTLQHGHMIYDTLFAMDRTFTPRPQMAGEHAISPDGLVHDLRLRPGLRFHDDTSVTAEDCIASIRR